MSAWKWIKPRVFLCSIILDMVVDIAINILLQEPNENLSLYRITQEHEYILQEPGSSQPLMAARPLPPAAFAGPVGCAKTIGQGCVKNIVVQMKCVNGTYVDACNTCHCAKVRSVRVCVGVEGHICVCIIVTIYRYGC